jgi:hypothetical protein
LLYSVALSRRIVTWPGSQWPLQGGSAGGELPKWQPAASTHSAASPAQGVRLKLGDGLVVCNIYPESWPSGVTGCPASVVCGRPIAWKNDAYRFARGGASA